jgi:hypothetical protein
MGDAGATLRQDADILSCHMDGMSAQRRPIKQPKLLQEADRRHTVLRQAGLDLCGCL